MKNEQEIHRLGIFARDDLGIPLLRNVFASLTSQPRYLQRMVDEHKPLWSLIQGSNLFPLQEEKHVQGSN